MRSFRNSLTGQILLGSIVVAIIVAFALTGSGLTGSATALVSDCAVKVGGHCINPKEYQAAYGLLTSVGINDQAAKRLNLRRQVARGLAERQVLLDRAREFGVATSEKDVDRDLAEGRTRVSLPARGGERLALSLAACIDGLTGCEPGTIGLRSLPVKKDGVFDFERYKRTVRVATGRSPGHFKEMQVEEASAERVRELVRSQVKVSEEEVYLAYVRARSQATARFVRIFDSWFQRYLVRLTEKDLSDFAAAHEQEITVALDRLAPGYAVGCPVVSEIRLDPPDTSDVSNPAAALEALRPQLKSAEAFAQAARRESRAPSARYAGAVGCLDSHYGQDAEALVKGLEGVAVGDVSSVIATASGPTLLRLEARVDAGNREQLRRAFVTWRLASETAAKEKVEAFAKSLIERTSGGEKLEAAALALVEEQLTSQGGGGKNGSGKDGLAEAARTADDRPRADISRPFSIEQPVLVDATDREPLAPLVFALSEPDALVTRPVQFHGGLAVLQLKEKDLATREKFAEERDQVIAQIWARKAEDTLASFVDALIQKAGGVTYDPNYVPDEAAEAPARSPS